MTGCLCDEDFRQIYFLAIKVTKLTTSLTNGQTETVRPLVKILIFETMRLVNLSGILVENTSIESQFLQREVEIGIYYPRNIGSLSQISLLLINDGQNMQEMGLDSILAQLYATQSIKPLLCVGIQAGADRKMEYGVAGQPDYKGRGAKAGNYTRFIFEELLPFLRSAFPIPFSEKAFSGFSLGGLSAMDIAWNHPGEFSIVGVFSGSLWWRSIDQTEESYDDFKHRIIHEQVKNGQYIPGMGFFFQCGNKDETKDRNHNGIIDSIDDTLDLIKELEAKGYKVGKDIYYLELKDGRHDIATWGRAMPVFLKWGWGSK